MRKFLTFTIVVLLMLATVSACASEPTPTPLPAPTLPPVPTAVPSTPTRIPPTNTPVPPTATTVPPTPAPPTATSVPPTTPPTIAPTNTAVPAPTVPPGLYVTNIRLQPEQPTFNQDISFAPTFLNTTGVVQNFRWAVYIYRADTPTKSDNDTAVQLFAIPVGTTEFQAIKPYRYGPTGNPCEFFFARVGWLDANNKITFFVNTDGKVYEKGFKICDAALIPTQVPPTPAPPTVPPTPKPGLFVNDLRIQPAPARGFDLTFFPTFVNTQGTPMTFTWRVVIFKADNLNQSYSETAWLQTVFPVNPGEVKSEGTWKLPLGGPCENFVARVGWRDANNQTQFFMRPDGYVFEKPFTVCPP